jgi:hypothetical protein
MDQKLQASAVKLLRSVAIGGIAVDDLTSASINDSDLNEFSKTPEALCVDFDFDFALPEHGTAADVADFQISLKGVIITNGTTFRFYRSLRSNA